MSANKHLFIADMHFGHNSIHEKFRTGFDTQEDHDNYIHTNILSVADKQSTLWILGDSFFKEKEFWRVDEYSKAFQQVNIVMGNHCHSGLPRYIFRTNKNGQYFIKNVNVFGSITKFGLWLSHVPVPDYELRRGNNICGHMHDRGIWRDGEEDDRYFCVSCENIDYKPISLGEIKKLRGWE